MSDTPTPTTTATVELPTDALAAVDDRAADEHLTDPEDVLDTRLKAGAIEVEDCCQ